MKSLVLCFLLVSPLVANEWVTLFDGETLKGWTNQGGDRRE